MANGDFVRYINGKLTELFALVQSAGAGSAGRLVKLDGSGRLDESLMPTGVGAEIVVAPASENLAAGDLVNIYDNTGIACRKADASDPAKQAHGFVLESVTSAANASIFLSGINDEVSGLTPGADLFLSASSAGGVAATAPTADGHIAQHVGYAIDANSMYFEPLGTLIVRANDD